jgi:CheY-like chemotaxis protein
LLTGRKLLVADDSVAIQKVVDLTFTDEGMEVIAVGDGDQARNKLEEIKPDIVLADAFMPGIDGYELCRIIRASERRKQIPVMLLVGSFEPFDEAEARRAGASDVVTKPFQSIRALGSRVGSLLGGKSEDAGATSQYSTLGLGRTEEDTPAASIDAQTTEPDLKVFVEAPLPVDESMQDANINVMVEAAPIPEYESEVAGASCVTDVETQTADTQQLERVSDDQFGVTTDPGIYAQDDTIEIEPLIDVEKDRDPSMNVSPVTERPWNAVEPRTPTEPAEAFSDSLLDLGEFNEVGGRAVDVDVVLDLDFEAPLPASESWPESVVGTVSSTAAAVANGSPSTFGVRVAETATVEQAVATEVQTEPQPEVPQWGVAHPPADVPPVGASEEFTVEPVAHTAQPLELSPESIDAIARRVVEQMSEKVVREIAWEVVPDLAELLIKERLDKQG